MSEQELVLAEEKLGTEELRQALSGVLELSVVVATLMRDGAQVGDLGDLWSKWQDDDVFRKSLEEAVSGVSNIGAEVKDLDLIEGMGIVTHILPYIPRLIEALKKPVG